ncbi:MAG: iron-sulfur cluster assembly scaffold protein [Planctomycetota bacterium]
MDSPQGVAFEKDDADDPFWGRMNDPSGGAWVVGLCGDRMEFYLYIRDGLIAEVRYHTNGCADTRTCGRVVAERATGRSLMDALAINPREIIDALSDLPESGRHCAILAVSALHRAIADYLLQP